jgi:hypothetical protein
VIDGTPAAGVQYSENWVEVNPTGGSPVGWVETHTTPQRHKGGYSYLSPRNSIRFCIEGIVYPFPENFQLLETRYGASDEGSLAARLRSVLAYDNNMILNIPIGSVDLTPNREALMNTDKTSATLEALLEDFVENVRISVGERFNDFSKQEALMFAANNLGLLADETASSSSCERTVLSTKRPEFYGFTLNGVKVPTWLKFDNNEFAYVGGSAKKVDFGTYIPLFEVFNEESYKTNVKAVLVETPDLSADTLELVRKNIKDYVKSLNSFSSSDNVIAIISDNKSVCENEWVSAAYEKVTLDTLYKTALKQRRERRSNAAKGLSSRPSLAYAMADFPASNGSSTAGFEITYVNSDIIGDGSGFVYVGLGEGVSPSANGVDSVEDAVKTVLSGGSKTVYADFISYAEPALAGRKVVFLNKGKKAAAFLKRHPKAVSFSQRVSEHIEGTLKSKVFSDVEVASMLSFHMTVKSYSNWNGESTPFMVFSHNMDKVASNLKGYTSGIKDKVLQRVVSDASVKGELYSFSRLFSLVPVNENKQVAKFANDATELNYSERLSLLSLASARYTTWGVGEAEQAVKLINSI